MGLHAAGLKEQWHVWVAGQHLAEWVALGTAPERAPMNGGSIFRADVLPGLWKMFIPMIFLVPTDNTPCEQRVSVYRHEVSQNQHESTVEDQWKYTCRLQPERERLKAIRSEEERYLDAKARERAAARKTLGRHTQSKRQLAELWRAQLPLALSYTSKEARLHRVGHLVRAVREQRNRAHTAAQEREVELLARSCYYGPKGGARRAAITAEEAVAFCPSLQELGKGGGKLNTAAGVKARIKRAKAELKERAAQRAAERAAAQEAKEARAAEEAAARRKASEEASGERIDRMWAAAPSDSEESEDELSDLEDEEDAGGGWGPDDEEESEAEEGSEDGSGSEDEGSAQAPCAKRPREMVREMASAADALAERAQHEAERAKRQAEKQAEKVAREREEQLAARAEAEQQRRRLQARRLGPRAVVYNYCEKKRIPMRERIEARLADAPHSVRDALKQLAAIDEQLRTLGT